MSEKAKYLSFLLFFIITTTCSAKGTFYILAGGQKIGKVEDGGVYYFINDPLGSTRVILDESEKEVWSSDYLPFGSGMDEQSSGTTETKTFSGKQFDKDTGLFYYGARYYDPIVGRFVSVDSSRQYASPYVYCGNNPLTSVDPDGRFSFSNHPGIAELRGFKKIDKSYYRHQKDVAPIPDYVASLLLRRGAKIVMFKGKAVTDLPEFYHLRGIACAGGRTYDEVEGFVDDGYIVYVGTAKRKDFYVRSVIRHEFAHALDELMRYTLECGFAENISGEKEWGYYYEPGPPLSDSREFIQIHNDEVLNKKPRLSRKTGDKYRRDRKEHWAWAFDMYYSAKHERADLEQTHPKTYAYIEKTLREMKQEYEKTPDTKGFVKRMYNWRLIH